MNKINEIKTLVRTAAQFIAFNYKTYYIIT